MSESNETAHHEDFDDHEADPMGESEARRLATWLSELPKDAVCAWGDMHLLIAPGVHRASWIDVTVEQACEDLSTGWCWTVVTPSDSDNDGTAWPDKASLTLVVEPDVTVHIAYDPSRRWLAEDGPVAVTEAGREVDPVALAPVQAHAESLGGEVVSQQGWTHDVINTTLATWTRELTGRNDIRFAFDDEVGRERVEALQEMADIDAEQCIDMGDNLLATPGAFDQLLELGPDSAAEITRTLKHIASRDSDGLDLGR